MSLSFAKKGKRTDWENHIMLKTQFPFLLNDFPSFLFSNKECLFCSEWQSFPTTTQTASGGPGSPIFSMVLCIYYEFQFQCSIYDYLWFLSLFRYFDDLRAVVVYKSSDITIKYLVQDLLHQLQHHTYHPSMKLILEEASNNMLRFLEGKFSMADSKLSCQWFSKNFE